ncbi:16S rRNA (adenine(1518)-N(6)/adenine(1519)-N(6))-dimethyltransferase RsmA [Paenibacillus thermoaerophilus]|uniref:Ribosomal RNA small subunit methyltransferase A n=1 Tax=Paenibacillus thermoaerophilus TaxID=1215385 RepID=A0ABW2V928_9BACL|nr:16S rRNA (adenine(1518)-N(6)/adenine(1519)-N(6))-dimethyltransferase RsmA [Paenibacillus thermoaerophilus]TMV09471.1 16S rRNA (adenine(1518)-N(6)/adenine(1519)-N(6))-dimethyltransferase RsmA [Paenibacillus thermoaerophilus]
MAQDIAAPSRTHGILKKYGLSAKKSLGQNFLTDLNILRKIAEAAELGPEDGALEIGPGLGALTEHLARKAGRVAAVELDDRLLPVLRETLAPYPQVRVIHGDVLKLDLARLWEECFADCHSVSVAANLPYYITTPILMKLIESGLPFRHIVVMIQKEVADRIAARPGSKDYGSLSVAIQFYCETETVTRVPPSVFVPQPNVESAVIRLTRRAEPAVRVSDEAWFFRVVQASFAQRRKTLANNLLGVFMPKGERARLEALLAEVGIAPGRRGETLSMDEFARLSERLKAEAEGRAD